MTILQRAWESLFFRDYEPFHVDKVLSADEDFYEFMLKDCPGRIFKLQEIDWCNGWGLSIARNQVNAKDHIIVAFAGDSRRDFYTQLAMARSGIRGIYAAIRTEKEVANA